eukprot:1029238_1
MSAHISGGYAKEPPTYGKVLLHTTIGDIDIELWPKQAPRAVRNFVQLSMENYYNDTIFHRVIPTFMAQTGDPTGTGEGGESIYGAPFKDEFHSRLTFSHRGIVAMANSGAKNDNKSQFFVTLDKCDWLNRKHTIFGKVTGNTIYNILKFNDLQIDKETERPTIEHRILSTEILLNPFDDITPRVIHSTTLKDDENDAKALKLKEKNKIKAIGARKDTKLLAFGEDEEDEDDTVIAKQIEQKTEMIPPSTIAKENETEVMDRIRAKLSTKRTFSEMEDAENVDAPSKKRKMMEEPPPNDANDEYEALKKQLLEKQNQRANKSESENEEIEDKPVAKTGVNSLLQQRNEYMQKTRMNKKDRRQFTLNKLAEFKQIMDGTRDTQENKETKKKGQLDENTGIQFDSESDDDDQEYDPNWFKNKLEFKKRPQDIEIYSVDDYKTIYGNSAQTRDKSSMKKKKKETETGSSSKYKHNTNRRHYSDRAHHRRTRR